MKRFIEKLKGKTGASILIALLFMLICVMTAASMIAAASSDSGKHRSVRSQQQKYLTLTSGFGVVRDALACENCYVGRYNVYEWNEEIRTKHTSVDSETGEVYVWYTSVVNDYFYVVQDDGEFSCYGLENYVGLKDDLDYAFGNLFDSRGAGYERLEIPMYSKDVRKFRVVLPDGLQSYPDGSDGEAYGVTRAVMLQSELNPSSFNIEVTAWLGEVDSTDYAEIPANKSDTLASELHPLDGVVTLDYEPDGRIPGVGVYESGVVVDNVTTFKYVTPSGGETLRETPGTSWFVYYTKKGVS